MNSNNDVVLHLGKQLETLNVAMKRIQNEFSLYVKGSHQLPDPALEAFRAIINSEVEKRVSQFEPRQKGRKPRSSPRNFTDEQKGMILAEYDSAISAWRRGEARKGAGRRVLARHNIYSNAYITIWRKELAAKI